MNSHSGPVSLKRQLSVEDDSSPSNIKKLKTSVFRFHDLLSDSQSILLSLILSFLSYPFLIHNVSLVNQQFHALSIAALEILFEYEPNGHYSRTRSNSIVITDRFGYAGVLDRFRASVKRLKLGSFRFSRVVNADLLSKILSCVEPVVKSLDLSEICITSTIVLHSVDGRSDDDVNDDDKSDTGETDGQSVPIPFGQLEKLIVPDSYNINLLETFCQGDRSRFKHLLLISRGLSIMHGENFSCLRYANFGGAFGDGTVEEIQRMRHLRLLVLPEIPNTSILETIRTSCPQLEVLKLAISSKQCPTSVAPFNSLQKLSIRCNLQTFTQIFSSTHPKLYYLSLRVDQGDLELPTSIELRNIALKSLKMKGKTYISLLNCFNTKALEYLHMDAEIPDIMGSHFGNLKCLTGQFRQNLDLSCLVKCNEKTLQSLELTATTSDELNLKNVALATNLRHIALRKVHIKQSKSAFEYFQKELSNIRSITIENEQRELSLDMPEEKKCLWESLSINIKCNTSVNKTLFDNAIYLKHLTVISTKDCSFWQISEALNKSNIRVLQSLDVSFTGTKPNPYLCFYVIPACVRRIKVHFLQKFKLREWLLLITCCHWQDRIEFDGVNPKEDFIAKQLLGTKYRKQLRAKNFWVLAIKNLQDQLLKLLEKETMIYGFDQEVKLQVQNTFKELLQEDQFKLSLVNQESLLFAIRYLQQLLVKSIN